jgi:hypothetical protein
LDWDKNHANIHKQLPESYPDYFATSGYNHSSHSNEQTPDGASVFCQILCWKFDREDLMTPADSRIMNGAEIIISDFRSNLMAVMGGNPKIAAETLTKAIDKFDFSREALMAVKINRVCVAKDFSWRAWCNWRRAKDNYDELTVQKRLKLLDYVLNDCGFVTGKILNIY